MGRGRPRKQARKLAGLKNHSPRAPHAPLEAVPNENAENESDDGWDPRIFPDSNKLIAGELETETEISEASEWGDLDNEEFQVQMVDMARDQGDDPTDEDWLSPELRKKKRKQEKEKKCMLRY
jgi:hypothetical protein